MGGVCCNLLVCGGLKNTGAARDDYFGVLQLLPARFSFKCATRKHISKVKVSGSGSRILDLGIAGAVHPVHCRHTTCTCTIYEPYAIFRY